MMTRFTTAPAPFGSVGIVGTAEGLSHVYMMKARPGPARDIVQRRHPDARADRGLLPGFQEELALYFSGRPVSFCVSVDLASLTEFQRRVLRACSRIEYGRTITYGDLARRIGCPAGARAVGGALARNPVPLVIPCHRVVGCQGGLGGFSAEQGVRLKRFLLDLESRECGMTRSG